MEDFGENVSIILADKPAPDADWRAAEGYGWIFKAWFGSSAEASEAHAAITDAGWKPEPRRWGRKVRVGAADGFDGEKLIRFVSARWPGARVQLRND